jgi:hypothetical protein
MYIILVSCGCIGVAETARTRSLRGLGPEEFIQLYFVIAGHATTLLLQQVE